MNDSNNRPRVRREVGNRTEWTCGCVMVKEGGELQIAPCSTACPVYVATVRQSRERGSRVEYRRSN
jgi:hypothetical protein